jgi:NitT/TauT family transport system substrate-binding protein
MTTGLNNSDLGISCEGVLGTNRCGGTMRIDSAHQKMRILTMVTVVGLLLGLEPLANRAFGEPLRLGVYRGAHSALIYLADAEGFFRKQGIDIVIKEYEAGVLAANDMVADNVDVATAAEFVFVLQSDKHPDLRMLATICAASDQELVVRSDRGIAKPLDFKGKRVAVTRGSSAEFFLYSYFTFNHIPAESVQVVYQTPSEMVKAMADGSIDAALCWPPYTTGMAKHLGVNGIRWPAQSGQDQYFALLAKAAFLKKQPKTIEKLLTALADAEAFISKYPDKARSILGDRLKADAGQLLETWSRARFRLQLTQDLLVLMEREAKWAIRRNLIDKSEVPNYIGFLYFQALEKIGPEAVSIVH